MSTKSDEKNYEKMILLTIMKQNNDNTSKNQDDEINQIKETAKETTYKTDGVNEGCKNQHYGYH